MSMDWHRVEGVGVSLDVPGGVVAATGEESDGAAVTFAGEEMRVILDASPFADSLTRYESYPEFEKHREEIDGEMLDVVCFRAPNGTRVVGARLRGVLTAVVHMGSRTEKQAALKVLRSIRFRKQGEK